MKRKILILSFIISSFTYSLDITGSISTGLGINIGANNISKPVSLVPAILNLTLPQNYVYLEEKEEEASVVSAETDNFNPTIDKYKPRLKFIGDQTKSDIRAFARYFFQNANIEKTLVDANLRINDIGLSLGTKVKSKTNRLNEKFTYTDVDRVLYKLDWDTNISDLSIRYDALASSKIKGVEKYLDNDYDENSPTEDKSLKINSKLDILKKSSNPIKPKIYLNYDKNGDKNYYLEAITSLAIEPVKGLQFEVGVVKKSENKNNEENQINYKEIAGIISKSAPGYNEYEYYKKFTQGPVRDIKQAIITPETGINRIDGLPSGSLYGESVFDFLIKTTKDYLKNNNYDTIHRIITKIENDENIKGTAFFNILTLKNEGERLSNNIPDLSRYFVTELFNRLNFSYDDGWHKYDPLSFVPKTLYPLIPGYEHDYLKLKDRPYFDVNKLGDVIKEFEKEMRDMDPNYPEYYSSNDYVSDSALKPTDSYPWQNRKIVGEVEIDGKKYNLVRKFSYIGYDINKYLVDPLISFLNIEKLKQPNYLDLLFNVDGYLSPIYKLLNKREEVSQIDLLRGIYLYETEYQNNSKNLYNEVYKNILGNFENKNKYIFDSEYVKSNKNIIANISYNNNNDKFKIFTGAGISVENPTILKREFYVNETDNYTSPKNIYGENNNIVLNRISKDNDELAQGKSVHLIESVKPLYARYITKYKMYTYLEDYKLNKINGNFNFLFDNKLFKLTSSANLEYQKLNYDLKQIGKVYLYDEGILHKLFGTYKEKVKLSEINYNDGKTNYEKEYKLLSTEMDTYIFTPHIGVSYSVDRNNNFDYVYGINWYGNYKFIDPKKLEINGEKYNIDILKRDDKNNPLANKNTNSYKENDSVIIKDETEYSLKEKLEVTKVVDGLKKINSGTQKRLFEQIDEIEPYIIINYKPVDHLIFTNVLKAPFTFNSGTFASFLFSLESRVGVYW